MQGGSGSGLGKSRLWAGRVESSRVEWERGRSWQTPGVSCLVSRFPFPVSRFSLAWCGPVVLSSVDGEARLMTGVMLMAGL